VDSADIQGKFSMVKHSQLAKIHENHESCSPSNDLMYAVSMLHNNKLEPISKLYFLVKLCYSLNMHFMALSKSIVVLFCESL